MVAGLAVAGCEPQFETRTIYVPPDTPEAEQCLVQARLDRIACLAEARSRFEDCRAVQTREAEPRFRLAQDEFGLDQQIYFQCRNSALQEIALLNDQREAECRRLADGGAPCAPGDGFITGSYEIDRFVDRRCREPDRPVLDDFVDLAVCGTAEGSCGSRFDAAYVDCGGQVRRFQECVANCG